MTDVSEILEDVSITCTAEELDDKNSHITFSFELDRLDINYLECVDYLDILEKSDEVRKLINRLHRVKKSDSVVEVLETLNIEIVALRYLIQNMLPLAPVFRFKPISKMLFPCDYIRPFKLNEFL